MRAVSLVSIFCLATVLALEGQSKNRTHIFLITVDTLRADHVHCYGYLKSTPALDALAADGVRFTETFTPSPITNTSHATILTGLLPNLHGVTDFAKPLSTAHQTMAELLRADGYQTAAFIGAIILDSRTLAPGFDRGFDFYDNFPEHPLAKARWNRLERRAMTVVQHAQSWLNAHASPATFIWLHLYDPHDPYEPPAPFPQSYDGEVAYADSAIGNFLAYLKNKGLYESSIVIVIGDHGEGLGEHHEDTHGIFLYDSTTHVPLIVKLPHQLYGNRVVDEQVRTIDILPTVLDAAGISVPHSLSGRTLMPLITGTDSTERMAVAETDYPVRFGWAPLRSVRSEGFKFIEAPRPEFYDLHSDPAELKNKYEPWSPTVQRLRALLTQAGVNPVAEASTGSVSENTLEELRALGYLGSTDQASSTKVSEPSLLPDPKDHIEEQNLMHLAMMAEEDSRFSDARLALRKALLLNPESYSALQQLSAIELQTHQYTEAEVHLKHMRLIRPDDAVAAFDEGSVEDKLGNLRVARQALDASLRLAPNQVPARLLLGDICLSSKDTQAAESQFEAVLQLQPGNVAAQLGIARVSLAEGKITAALSMLTELSRENATNPEVFDMLAQTYRRSGRGDLAAQAQKHASLLRKHKSRSLEEPRL
jgi:arylsulfatase A-like enzyme/cytochrome c-type biogenesis protein CcmH/NrfG